MTKDFSNLTSKYWNALQEHIDKYLASCKRTAGLWGDESDDPMDDDDAEKEIHELEKWLGEQQVAPAAVPPLGSVKDGQGRCVDCGWSPCKCNLT